MRNVAGVVLGVMALGTAAAVTAAAQPFDMAAIRKWTGAKVVRYQVTGTFQGTAPLALDGQTSYAEVDLTDQVTLTFDWDVQANKPVGTVAFANTPSKIAKASSGEARCPPPNLRGTYEYFEATEVAASSDKLVLKGTRSLPAADISSDWPATCTQKPAAAAQETVTEYVAVVAPMLLAMPPQPNAPVTVSADKKSFTIKTNTWSWTYTPTLVK